MLKGRGLLTPLQREFLQAFSRLQDADQFYLTGGTALTEFYLGHRLSFDVDLFTAQVELVLPVSLQVEALRRPDWQVSVTRRFSTFVELLVTGGEESLRVDLALDSPFRFEPPCPAEVGIRVNGERDLCVDKLLAYYGRSEPRDAVDLHFILQRYGTDDLLAWAAQKDSGFDLYWFAVALNRVAEFPDELERWPVRMLMAMDPRQLKGRFVELASQLMSRVVGR